MTKNIFNKKKKNSFSFHSNIEICATELAVISIACPLTFQVIKGTPKF